MDKCPVCANRLSLKYRLRYNVYKCEKCKGYFSNAAFDHSMRSDLQEEEREVGLKQLRLQNFNAVADELGRIAGEQLHQFKGLEIGSGNGWWLWTCKQRGIACTGIEPEIAFTEYYREHGLTVDTGFYPLPGATNRYGFIVFNDVFEHIPDINALAAKLYADLDPNGILIINLPLSTGFFYRCARLLNALGMKGFLERMWQFHFHSPHVSYFNAPNLQQLLARYGFSLIGQKRLETLDFSTVKQRILADKRFGRLQASIVVLLLRVVRPIIRAAPPDIMVFFFKKN